MIVNFLHTNEFFHDIGYIDRVRTLQNENHKLYHQVRTFEEYKQTEISNVKELYDNQVRHFLNINYRFTCNWGIFFVIEILNNLQILFFGI